MNMRDTGINTAEDGIERPLVSIIVPTRNSAKTLETCLKSIKNQSYKNIELILVDNNSTDETKEIARKYTQLVFNKGPERNVQRVYAASKAKGEYLVFIDSDMELPPSLIESALSKCKKEGFDAVILPEIAEGKGFWSDCRRLETICYFNDKLMEAANRFMKAGVYHDIGGYEKEMILQEDFDIHDRLKEAGYRIGRAEEVIRHHEVDSFFKTLGKYYYYTSGVLKPLKKNPKMVMKRNFIIRPAFLRNWRLFINDPVHGLGLMIMKSLQYVAGTLGLLSTLFIRHKPKEQTVLEEVD